MNLYRVEFIRHYSSGTSDPAPRPSGPAGLQVSPQSIVVVADSLSTAYEYCNRHCDRCGPMIGTLTDDGRVVCGLSYVNIGTLTAPDVYIAVPSREDAAENFGQMD